MNEQSRILLLCIFGDMESERHVVEGIVVLFFAKLFEIQEKIFFVSQ